MTKVYASPDLMLAELAKSLLEDQGIECIMRHQDLITARGRVPFTDTWPEVWVVNEADAASAMNIIEQMGNDNADNAPSWICPNCGEECEGQFSSCWNCQTEKPTA